MDKLSSSELKLLDKSIEKVDTVIDTDPQYEAIFEQWFELGQEIYDIDDLVDSYRNLQNIIEDEGERNSKLNKLVSGIVKILDKL